MSAPKPPEGTRTVASRALRAAARGESPAPARLQILDGPMAGRSLPLGEEETVGRGSGASLSLPDPAASRLHLRLRLGAGVVTAEDLGSKNGSRLNSRRLRAARTLRPGDELTVGTTRLRLESTPGAAPDDLARAPPASPPSPRTGSHPALEAPLLAGVALALLAAAAALVARG